MPNLIHYAPCVQNPFSKMRPATVDPTKVTCPFCRSMAAILTPAPLLAEEKPVPPAVPDVPVMHWTRGVSSSKPNKTDDPTKVTCKPCRQGPRFAEALRNEISRKGLIKDLQKRGRLQRAVTDANRSVERAERELRGVALVLAERVDALKSAKEALRKYTEEGTASPSGSTESAEQAVPVPEAGPKFPKAQKASQGLRDFNVTLQGPDLTRFISDLSIPLPYLGTEQHKLCGCALCMSNSYRQYKPGPF